VKPNKKSDCGSRRNTDGKLTPFAIQHFRKVIEDENEKKRQLEIEEQERIKRLEKAKKEQEAREKYNNSSMGEVD
jgi:septal ring factor EnvC (AmiA/AmiB activator)